MIRTLIRAQRNSTTKCWMIMGLLYVQGNCTTMWWMIRTLINVQSNRTTMWWTLRRQCINIYKVITHVAMCWMIRAEIYIYAHTQSNQLLLYGGWLGTLNYIDGIVELVVSHGLKTTVAAYSEYDSCLVYWRRRAYVLNNAYRFITMILILMIRR